MASSHRVRRARRPCPPRAGGDLREQLVAAGAPPGVLAVLEDARDIDDVLGRLISAGLLPTPEQSLAATLAGWAPLLRNDCDPLSAELAGYELLATMRAAGAADADLPDILTGLIDSAEQARAPEAVAMLRVLSAMAPIPVRPTATAAAQRLVDSGLTDPAWAHTVGRPTIRSCFGYADMFGAQEVLALAFGYGRKQHAVAVLIDHALGGGVKDCYVAGKPRMLRTAYEDSARRSDVDVYDYSEAGAVDILDRALAAQPCPVEADQRDDVATYLDLLRQRVELLRAGPPPAAGAARRSRP